MVTTIGLVSGAVVLVILIGLHGVYNKEREARFPVKELEKFNKSSE
ncbi:hypothetical protein JOC37_001922 [Desulfohalotomaculum tongense]|nr:hypothetical protein [Desulforadius tongensis]MBM7855525.1 hypothetical protein [Desulforadius tongensis]